MKKQELEYLRYQARDIFQDMRSTWIDLGRWGRPHRIKWLLSQTEGVRNNFHVVDTTHILALRSYVAGFLEGNTSASRAWYRYGTGDRSLDTQPGPHKFLDAFNQRTLRALNVSNFYHAAGEFYYDFGTFNTGAHYIEELDNFRLFFHTLTPGSYYVINDGYGEAVVLVREFSLRVKAVVDTYGRLDQNGKRDWSNISSYTRKMYEEGTYKEKVDIAQVVQRNPDFDPNLPVGGENRQWKSCTYEIGTGKGSYSNASHSEVSPNPLDDNKHLRISYSKRKPFVVGKSHSNMAYEYGETGPTLEALGLIKSLNKKAISKDRALEQMVNPSVQGPASLRKSYVSTAPNKFVPLDPTSAAKGGLKRIFEINPAIGALIQDTGDLRQMVDKHYYADFLLFLSKNPKTRTATETDAIVKEQQLVIGPNLQSLNFTYNQPIVDFVADYVLDNDPDLPPIPDELRGRFLRPEFISVFAQVQRAADLPSIEQYVRALGAVSQLDPRVLDKMNLDKLADIYEDRLYLPEGLNRGQDEVDVMREQAQAQAQRQQQMEQLTQMSQAAKNVGIKANQNQGEEQ